MYESFNNIWLIRLHHFQYPTTNHFHPSVDQYGYPMMNNRLPNQNPQSMDQSQRGSNQRRHTVNNVLSTISIQQQQNLQRVYQQNHIGNENPSPRHSPVNHQINHHHDSSQPSSNHMVIQQSQVQQQQQENSLISLRLAKLAKKFKIWLWFLWYVKISFNEF